MINNKEKKHLKLTILCYEFLMFKNHQKLLKY